LNSFRPREDSQETITTPRQITVPKILKDKTFIPYAEEDTSQVPELPQFILYNGGGAYDENDVSESEAESYDSESFSDLDMNGHEELAMPQASRPLRLYSSMNLVPNLNINNPSNQGTSPSI
jgi:hypothetical protein